MTKPLLTRTLLLSLLGFGTTTQRGCEGRREASCRQPRELGAGRAKEDVFSREYFALCPVSAAGSPAEPCQRRGCSERCSCHKAAARHRCLTSPAPEPESAPNHGTTASCH